MQNLNQELERYIRLHSSEEDPLLEALESESQERVVQPQMVSGHVQGLFLKMLTGMIRPRRVLEIGTFTGYATLCFAEAMPEDGIIDTVEIEDELEGIQSEFFARSPHGHKIRRHTGSALEVVPRLGECYDLVFIDPPYAMECCADAAAYLAEKELIIPGAIVVLESGEENISLDDPRLSGYREIKSTHYGKKTFVNVLFYEGREAAE